MKTILVITLSYLVASGTYAALSDTLYVATYGNKDHPTLIFLHGGPGYNAVSFENTVACSIADAGYFVVVLDQPGSGRSKNVVAPYTFEGFNRVLNHLYDSLHIKQATLIGHSFGGTLAIKYARASPDRVRSLILLSSPVSYPATFRTIIRNCRTRYEVQGDSIQLQYITMLESMDATSLSYSSYCFAHALQCGLYQPRALSVEATALYRKVVNSTVARYLTHLDREPVLGFHANEHYTTLDVSDDLSHLPGSVDVLACYGAEDGLFDKEHIEIMRGLIGEDAVLVFPQAGHSLFIDQVNKFIQALSTLTRADASE